MQADTVKRVTYQVLDKTAVELHTPEPVVNTTLAGVTSRPGKEGETRPKLFVGHLHQVDQRVMLVEYSRPKCPASSVGKIGLISFRR